MCGCVIRKIVKSEGGARLGGLIPLERTEGIFATDQRLHNGYPG